MHLVEGNIQGLKFLFESKTHPHVCSAWPGDAHTLLLGAGSFVALMVAGLITSARGPQGKFKKIV